jgi:hypothetical protein
MGLSVLKGEHCQLAKAKSDVAMYSQKNCRLYPRPSGPSDRRYRY